MARSLIDVSTIDNFYKLFPVPIVSTLHIVLPYNKYLVYIRISKKK